MYIKGNRQKKTNQIKAEQFKAKYRKKSLGNPLHEAAVARAFKGNL